MGRERRWWPFPGDALSHVLTVERDGHQVGRELVRGWGKSIRRINKIAFDVAAGGRGEQFVI
jgi:hypothetical protein